MRKFLTRPVMGACLVVLLTLAGSVNLLTFPPVWWDEGWTLSVARNWVERGHYGGMRVGEPAPPGLEAAFPVTAPVALSFHFFGIGIWQGRLPIFLFMIGAMAIMYYLALRLWNRSAAYCTLFASIFMSSHPMVHPFFVGRQVLAEGPMVFYLLSGYVFFLLAMTKSVWYLGGAVLIWAICLMAKAQVLPFWFFSLFLPLAIALFYRKKKQALLFGSALLASFSGSMVLFWLWQVTLKGHTMPTVPLQGMYDVTALVLGGFNRIMALQVILYYALPTLIALCFSMGKSLRRSARWGPTTDMEYLQLSLLALCGSWFCWYGLLSVAWPRYLFPSVFISNLFIAELLIDIAPSFKLENLKGWGLNSFRHWSFNRKMAGSLLGIILILVSLPPTVKHLYRQYTAHVDAAAIRAANFLNSQTPADTLIETYESELHFLLNRRVHYPPDQIHVELNRRTFLGQNVPIDYDPLASNPDFLVIGSQARMWRLYDPVVVSGAFRPVHQFGWYQIFERVR